MGLWSIDQITGRLTTTYGLDLGGNSIQNVSAILSASGKWRIDESGNLVVQKVTAETGEFKKGVTIYDPLGSPYCVGVEIGGIVSSKLGTCGTNGTPPVSEPDTASSTP